MRHTRAHTRNRRSHHALKNPRLTVSEKEGVVRPRHRALLDGSLYRGRSVMDKTVRAPKKAAVKAEAEAVGAPKKKAPAKKKAAK